MSAFAALARSGEKDDGVDSTLAEFRQPLVLREHGPRTSAERAVVEEDDVGVEQEEVAHALSLRTKKRGPAPLRALE